MRKILNNPLAVAGLCLIAGVILYLNGVEPSFEPATGTPVTPKKNHVLSPTDTSSQENVGSIELDKVGWTEAIVRDPFGPNPTLGEARAIKAKVQGGARPTTSRPQARKDVRLFRSLKLNAISVKPDSRMAVINRSIVKEKDRIKGFRIERIEPDGVTLNGPSGSYRLTFNRAIKS